MEEIWRPRQHSMKLVMLKVVHRTLYPWKQEVLMLKHVLSYDTPLLLPQSKQIEEAFVKNLFWL